MLDLRIYRLEPSVHVLGPGNRAGIWVQGCARGCPACIVPDSWNADGGAVESVAALAQWVTGLRDIEGITLAGGEPLDQAAALVELIDRIKSKRDIGVVCYTGYKYEEIGDRQQQLLLSLTDILIDGRYIRSRHADLLWRGSSNQRIHLLTERYRAALADRLGEGDRSAGLEFSVNPDGIPSFVGVPVARDFAVDFARRLRARGIRLEKGVRDEQQS